MYSFSTEPKERSLRTQQSRNKERALSKRGLQLAKHIQPSSPIVHLSLRLPQRPTPRTELLPAREPGLGHGLPLGDPSREFRIGFITDEGPAFLVPVAGGVVVVVGEGGTVLDQGFGVLEIAVDCLDGRGDAVFLRSSRRFSANHFS